MISIMMPVYNAAKYIRQSIESILTQTLQDFELIIVNDGSTDESEDIILSFSDPRIHYIKQENGGDAAARNAALKHMKGDYFTFQDADDISLPPRLEILMRHFTSPSVGFVHSDFLLINEQDQPIGYWAAGNIEPARMRRFFLKIGTPYNNPSMVVRREVMEGFQYDESQPLGSDTDMVFQTFGNWTTVHVPLPLVLYRRHTDNLSKKREYIVLFSEIRKFLNSNSLQELIPELNWKEQNHVENQAMASAIIALFLVRRGMYPDAKDWYEKALQKSIEIKSELSLRFTNAIGNMLSGNFSQAIKLLQACPQQDAVVLNYLGENHAYLKQFDLAYNYFLKSLQINPLYEEPLDNLKAIGWSKDFYLLDRSWIKFV